MEFRLFCPSCGQKLKAEEEDAGRRVDCPHCGVEFTVPHPEPATPPRSLPAEPQRDSIVASPNGDGNLSCPVCWLRFDTGDVMHIPSSGRAAPSLRWGWTKKQQKHKLNHVPGLTHGLDQKSEPGQSCKKTKTLCGNHSLIVLSQRFIFIRALTGLVLFCIILA